MKRAEKILEHLSVCVCVVEKKIFVHIRIVRRNIIIIVIIMMGAHKRGEILISMTRHQHPIYASINYNYTYILEILYKILHMCNVHPQHLPLAQHPILHEGAFVKRRKKKT